MMLDDIMSRAKADPAFAEIQRSFAEAGITSWLLEEEKALQLLVENTIKTSKGTSTFRPL